MHKQRRIDFSELDYCLLLITAICIIFGIIMIGSAVKSYDGGSKYMIMQAASAIIGFIMMIVITAIDYRTLSRYSKIIYTLCIFLLIAVLIFGTGREDTGSKSWIRFGSIGFQPSEIVKIGFIITFSKMVAAIKEEINKPLNILKLMLHAGVLLGLILLQPDFGTAMVFIAIFVGILFAAKISYKYIIGTGALIAAALPIIWNFFLAEYQKNRIRVLFDPESDPLGTGYHVIQSKIAIGSGGIFGKGFGQGTQTQLGFLPVKHTDFIYAVIGEELGMLGCLLVAALLFGLVVRCLYNAKYSKDNYSSFVCVGVACMFLAHTFENIGMCIGLMPVTGIPLPFFSYGGSAMITNLMAIGLVMGVYMRRKEISFE